jgi:D-alanyl-D-alanine carboxypeptidase
MKTTNYQARPLRAPLSAASALQRENSQDLFEMHKKFSAKLNSAGLRKAKLSFSSQSTSSKETTQPNSQQYLSGEDSITDSSRLNPISSSYRNQAYSCKNSAISKIIQKVDLNRCPSRDTSILQNISSVDEPVPKLKLPNISAKCWAVMDGRTGELLCGKKDNKKKEIASLTKMMNFLCVCRLIKEFNINPKETFVQVSRNAASMSGTSARLRNGDILSIYDLLHGLMLPSGNDAAMALAENFGEYIVINSEEYKQKVKNDQNGLAPKVKNPARNFIKLMNQVAKELDLTYTYYNNSHGLVDPNNYSTAADQAKLTYHLLKLDLVREVVDRKTYSCEVEQLNQKTRVAYWENTNELLGKKGWHGVKTGITTAAGPCLSAYYENHGQSYIVILMNSESKEIRWVEAPKLVEFAMDNKERLKEMSQGQSF